MKQEAFNELFRGRTKKLSLSIIKTVGELPYSDALGVIRKQVIRSSSSVAANFRAVCRARLARERYSKLCIVVEEADETLFWLEMLWEAGYIQQEELAPIYQEAEEILKVMSSFRSKIKP